MILLLSLWMLKDNTFYVRMAQDENNYYAGVYLLLSIGLLLFVVGFLGCCGAYRESRNTLTLFFCFLLIVLVAQISAFVWGYSNLDQLEALVRSNVASIVRNEYGIMQERRLTFDAIQEGLQCCGANGPSDWADSSFNNKLEKGGVRLAISSTPTNYNVPYSCCSNEVSPEVCKTITQIVDSKPISSSIYHVGCSSKLLDTIKHYSHYFIGVVVGINVIEILGLLCSLVLCCSIHVSDRCKN